MPDKSNLTRHYSGRVEKAAKKVVGVRRTLNGFYKLIRYVLAYSITCRETFFFIHLVFSHSIFLRSFVVQIPPALRKRIDAYVIFCSSNGLMRVAAVLQRNSHSIFVEAQRQHIIFM